MVPPDAVKTFSPSQRIMGALVRRLGQILIEQGLITPEQREQALRSQILYGGKIGTNLLELGAIEIDALARALAKQRGFPAALQKHFDQVHSEAVALVPGTLAQKHEAVPLGFTSRNPKTLAVAFADPSRAAAVDEIRFAAGTRIYPTIAPELRIIHYLEKLYGIRRPLRFRQMEPSAKVERPRETAPSTSEMKPFLLTDAIAVEPTPFAQDGPTSSAVDELANELTPTPVFPIPAAASVGHHRGGFAPSAAPSTPPAPTPLVTNEVTAAPPEQAADFWDMAGEQKPLDHTPPFGLTIGSPPPAEPEGDRPGEFAVVATVPERSSRSAPPSASPRDAINAEQAVDAITDAINREEIGNAIVDYLRSSFGFGLLFIVQQEIALGWKGFAPGVDDAAFQSLAIPLTAPSVLRLAYDTKTMFRGTPRAEGAALDGILWRQLRSSRPQDVVVAPVVLKNRVVTLIYAHATGGGALPDAALVDLTMLCPYAAAGFIRLIQAAKRWKS